MKAEQVRANGILMQCRVEGPPSAQALLLCNGLATDMAMWDRQVSEFSKNYRVITFDTRGHGETSATPPPYTLSMLVEDTRSLLDALGIEQVHYVGMSLGGMVGQAFAIRYPQRLLSLSLCDTAAKTNREVWEARIKQVEVAGIAPMIEPSIVRWFTKPFRDANPALMDNIREMIKRVSHAGYLGGAGVVMEMNHVDKLDKISTPTLIIVGRQDSSTPVAASEEMHQHIAGAQLHIIEAAAHLPNIEQPEEFNRLLKQFLSRLDEVALESKQ